MRETLSSLLVESAKRDPRFVVLSGDHGYALFDGLRKARPDQFLNVGIAEQGMVGYAAGLAETGFRPVVYGLSAFVPIRVLEQIKLDVCLSRLPVTFLGDGAGLVYSTLGASHHCAEDLACLRPLPFLRIYSPCDAHELEACFVEAMGSSDPSYIRIGKSDRPVVRPSVAGTAPGWTHKTSGARTALLSHGSMTAVATDIARDLGGLDAISVPRLKPFDLELVAMMKSYERVIVVEEHSRYGGLASAVCELALEGGVRLPQVISFALKDQFPNRCGSWQYALSEHELSDAQLKIRVAAVLAAPGGK